jgi:hypothetical protein
MEKDRDIASLKDDLSKFDEENFNTEMSKVENLRKSNSDLRKELDRKNRKILNLELFIEKLQRENQLLKQEKENYLFQTNNNTITNTNNNSNLIYNNNNNNNELQNYKSNSNFNTLSNINKLKNKKVQSKNFKKEFWKYEKNPEFINKNNGNDKERSFLSPLKKNFNLENNNSKGIFYQIL